MSLINEALKKAQSERTSSLHKHPAIQGMSMEPHQKPPKKKRYLLSFVLAVLIVALLSTLVSTYLVYKIMGESEPAQETSTVPVDVASAPEKEALTQVEEKSVQESPVEPVAIQAPAVEESAAEATEAPAGMSGEPVAATGPATQVPETGLANPVDPVVSSAPAAPSVEEPVPQVTSVGTDPQIWQRLEDLEIRGIMSGATKVLIFDSRTGKARAYKPGDLVDGALSIKVSTISETLINFENNEGLLFPKSF